MSEKGRLRWFISGPADGRLRRNNGSCGSAQRGSANWTDTGHSAGAAGATPHAA